MHYICIIDFNIKSKYIKHFSIMSKKRPQIIVEHSTRKRIANELGTSYPTIRVALFGMTHTDKADAIRKKALELGGVELNS